MSALKVVLHHLNHSRSMRIAWLLEELKVDYDIKVYFRSPLGLAPPELKQISPLGKAPVVQLGDRSLFESGAIVAALAAEFSQPSFETSASPDSTFWSFFSEGSLLTQLQGAATAGGTAQAFAAGAAGAPVSDEGKKAVLDFVKFYNTAAVAPNVGPQLAFVENWLAAHPAGFFSGSDKLGSGDILMSFPLESLAYGDGAKAGFSVGPQTRAWVDRVRARPAHQRALARLQESEDAAQAKL
ncbi:bifunctional glutathione transferase/peroxidase [Cryptotrichosporon argae]